MVSACSKNDSSIAPFQQVESLKAAQTAFLENFETGTKAAYATGNVTLTTGSWSFNDALIGNSSSDHKDGTQASRIRNSGIISMNFDKTNGAGTITIKHAKYGSDASSTWQLWYSTNSGSSYTQNGSTITSSSTTLQTATFTLNVSGNIKWQYSDSGSQNRWLNKQN
jgi:endonuclease G